MTAQDVFALIKDIRPGVWKIGVTYKKDLPILKGRGKGPSPAEIAGINPGDLYKVVFRWCSASVNKKNTKAYQNARAASQQKAAEQGKEWTARPTGFHASDNEEEHNIIEYRDGTNIPCLILKKGPHADKVKYFFKGQEISLQDIQDFINQKVVSKTALSELAPNEVFYLYPEKVQSLKIDGQLHEEFEENYMNEAMFNGVALPNEDGFYDMDEELNETKSTGKYNMKQQFYPNKSHPGPRNIIDERYFITKVYGDGDSGDVYYLGTDVGAAMNAVDNCYPDWEDMGLGGGDSYPATFEYIGSAPDFANFITTNNVEAAYDYFMNNQNDFKEIYSLEEELAMPKQTPRSFSKLNADQGLPMERSKHNFAGDMDLSRYYSDEDKNAVAKRSKISESNDSCMWILTDDSDSDYYDSAYKFKYRLSKNCPQYQKIIEDLLALYNEDTEPEEQCTLEDVPNGCEVTAEGYLSTSEYDDDYGRLTEISLPDICWEPLIEVHYTNHRSDLAVDKFLESHGLDPDELEYQFKDDMYDTNRECRDARSAAAYDNAVWKHMVGLNAGLNTSKQSAAKITEEKFKKKISKVKISESLDREARKYGYRNYKEYQSNN